MATSHQEETLRPKSAIRGSQRTSKRRSASAALRRFWLALLVHADALRFDPPGYAKALFWRLRRLRVRSRNQLAALMGRSPNAYALWIARVEPGLHETILAKCPPRALIEPVVDGGRSTTASDLTVASIEISGFSAPLILREVGSAADAAKKLGNLVSPQGNWLCIVNAGDRLAKDALDIYSSAAACFPDSWVIYADDDLIGERGRREPHFKPDWNPELFEHHDFITGSAIIRLTPGMLRELAKSRSEDWQTALVRKALKRGPPVHLPVVLHHRESRPKPSVPAKPPLLAGRISPLVSVIVPTRNRLSLLRTCIEGVGRTAYPNVELIVVNNDSDDPGTLAYFDALKSKGTKILDVTGAFNFSAMNNLAAKHATGELLCFLNNDVEVIDGDWLSLLVLQAIKEDIGAVGARLLYPDGTVQHAGVVTGVGGGAAHAHRYQRDEEIGYFLRDRLPQRVSAVTAACLLVAKDKFLDVGGFNEKDFPVAFNDVDLCLKLNARGWQSFYEPRAVLIHHESKSRGSDSAKENRARFANELAALKRHWNTDQLRDPYHHPQLSPFCERFYVAL
jgi:GT2 family glycosyltransferase